MIRIGTRSFLIKQLKCSYLEITDPFYSKYVFEHRQGFFHISLIPVFPTEQFWIMKEDKESFIPTHYEVPSFIQERIDQLGYSKSKTLWYSYALFILIPVIGILFFSYEFVHKKIAEKKQHDYIQNMANQIDSLNTTGYISMYSNDFSRPIFSKVEQLEKDSIKISISSNQESKYYSLDFTPKFLELFSKKEELRQVWVSKDFLKKSILSDNGIVDSKIGFAEAIKVREIKFFSGPIILNETLGFNYETNTAEFTIENVGFSCLFENDHFEFPTGEKLIFSQRDFKKGDKIFVQLILPNSKEEYLGKENLNNTYWSKEIGKINSLDIINNKRVRIEIKYNNENFKIVYNNE